MENQDIYNESRLLQYLLDQIARHEISEKVAQEIITILSGNGKVIDLIVQEKRTFVGEDGTEISQSRYQLIQASCGHVSNGINQRLCVSCNRSLCEHCGGIVYHCYNCGHIVCIFCASMQSGRWYCTKCKWLNPLKNFYHFLFG